MFSRSKSPTPPGDHPKGEITVACLGASLLLLLLAGCATARTTLEKVGPESPTAQTGDGQGSLIVYTPWSQTVESDVIYRKFSSYDFYGEDGKLARHVGNQAGGHSEKPDTVSVPAGNYVVRAAAEGLGPVEVPILIQGFKTTEVHLENGWKPKTNHRGNADLVRLPNGQAIGWRVPSKPDEILDEKRAARADAIVKVKLLNSPDAVGTAAYALVETVAVIRNTSDRSISGVFTVGYSDIKKGVPRGLSVLYLKLSDRADGSKEWRLLED